MSGLGYAIVAYAISFALLGGYALSIWRGYRKLATRASRSRT